MSGDLRQLEDRLAELEGQRAELESVKTIDDAAKAARDFCALSRRTDVRAFVLGAVAVGEPLQAVINAFVLSDPRFESWATEQAQAVDGVELTDRQKKQQLARLDSEIAKKQNEAREAAKVEAIREVEERFAPEAA